MAKPCPLDKLESLLGAPRETENKDWKEKPPKESIDHRWKLPSITKITMLHIPNESDIQCSNPMTPWSTGIKEPKIPNEKEVRVVVYYPSMEYTSAHDQQAVRCWIVWWVEWILKAWATSHSLRIAVRTLAVICNGGNAISWQRITCHDKHSVLTCAPLVTYIEEQE